MAKTYYVGNSFYRWKDLKTLRGKNITTEKNLGVGFMQVYSNKKDAKKYCENGFFEIEILKKGE